MITDKKIEKLKGKAKRYKALGTSRGYCATRTVVEYETLL